MAGHIGFQLMAVEQRQWVESYDDMKNTGFLVNFIETVYFYSWDAFSQFGMNKV